ncbi:hypothetical protein HMPREF1326_03296 [Akkermansia sp. KLE1605]|nr:hypothetical protein HMPREF1326_03296 [Akkermansia sp. KLE1605]
MPEKIEANAGCPRRNGAYEPESVGERASCPAVCCCGKSTDLNRAGDGRKNDEDTYFIMHLPA